MHKEENGIINELLEGRDVLSTAQNYVGDIVPGGIMIEVIAVQVIVLGLLIYIAFIKKCT